MRNDMLTVLLKEFDQSSSSVDGPFRRLLHTFKEKAEPRFPISLAANSVEQSVVSRTVLLEIETQVKERFTQDTGMAEQESNKQSAHPAVAVEERVYGLELNMGKAYLYEHRKVCVFIVQEELEIPHAFRDKIRRWRDKRSVTRPGSTDPILRAAKFAGALLASSTS
jgi:hypothetical protein